MAVNPYDAAKNLGLGKGYSVEIMARRPTMPRGPSDPALRMPSFKTPDLSVKLPSANLKSPTFTQNFDPKVRTMYADDYDAFMANKASEAAKATNATTPATPTVMGSPDATSPDLMSSPASLANRGKTYNERVKDIRNQIGITGTFPEAVEPSPRPNFYEKMGPVPRYTPYEMIDMYSKEKAYDYIGRISDDEAKKIDPRGKQGLLDYLVESLKKRKIPQPPRQFSWRQGEKAPERDWEAIMDFQKFVGSKPGPYIEGKGRTINFDVDKALKNPGMVNESFAKNLTVTNLTPELRASLEAKGFKFKTWDEKLFPNMNKLGDGKLGVIEFGSAVDAVKSLAALKAAGADTNMEGLQQVAYRGI